MSRSGRVGGRARLRVGELVPGLGDLAADAAGRGGERDQRPRRARARAAPSSARPAMRRVRASGGRWRREEADREPGDAAARRRAAAAARRARGPRRRGRPSARGRRSGRPGRTPTTTTGHGGERRAASAATARSRSGTTREPDREADRQREQRAARVGQHQAHEHEPEQRPGERVDARRARSAGRPATAAAGPPSAAVSPTLFQYSNGARRRASVSSGASAPGKTLVSSAHTHTSDGAERARRRAARPSGRARAARARPPPANAAR